MIVHSFLTGLLVGFSLIIAFGAQNIFVLNHGLMRRHVFEIVLFCSLADFALISLGIAGISHLEDSFGGYKAEALAFSAAWLFVYAMFKLKSAISPYIARENFELGHTSFGRTLGALFFVTFGNPHVYLDTVILIGSISQQFIDLKRIYFAVGACTASFVWFFGIAYGAKLLTPIMQTPRSWRILDLLIAIIMFILGFNLLFQGSWI